MEGKDARAYGEELLQLVELFRQRIIAGTSAPDSFLTITDIERLWSELRGDTSILYSDMLSDILSGADESELIRKKKRSTRKQA